MLRLIGHIVSFLSSIMLVSGATSLLIVSALYAEHIKPSNEHNVLWLSALMYTAALIIFMFEYHSYKSLKSNSLVRDKFEEDDTSLTNYEDPQTYHDWAT